MRSKLEKFKKYEIEKSKLKNINGESWVCSMTDIKGSALVTKHSQVKAFLARGYRCTQPRLKHMNVVG